MTDLDALIEAFPRDASARRELVAFRADQDPEASLDASVEWLMFSAIDGGAVDDVQEWSDAVCDAAFPRGWEGDALGEAIAKLWQAAAKKAPRRRRRSNPDADEAPAAYQVRRAAKNSRKVLPMPGKSFSAQELQDLKAWFKARGADAVFAEGAGLRVIADVDNIDDVVPNYVEEKKLARSRLALEARDAADRERRAETEKRLSESPAAAWVQRTFSAVNAFNKAALARYIDGTDKTFQGLLSGTFLEGALSLGFSEEQLRAWSGEELLKAIKHAYEASPRENPDGWSNVRFVYGVRRLARGGFAPVVVEHGDSGKPHQHGGWVAQGYDEDVALAVAKAHAEELASQYVGDWNIEIVPEFPSEGRRNPSPGFTSKFSFFSDDDYTPPPLTETRRVFRDVKRGDVVTVGKTRWVIMRPVGDVQAYAYKHPSKRTKLYEVRVDGGEGTDEAVVFEIGGSAQRISDDLVRGPLRATRETVEL